MSAGIVRIVLATLVVVSPARGVPGPGRDGTFGNRRAVVFGIDGCRADALKLAVENGTVPNIGGLIKDGAVTWNAFAGGVAGTPTQQSTLSGPGWSSVLTGVWRDKHGVSDNGFAGQDFAAYPHFFRRLREVEAGAELVSLVSWPEIHDQIVNGSGGAAICGCQSFANGSYDQRDAALIGETVNLVSGANPDVIFCYQGNVDIAGHTFGFGPAVPEYMASIAAADQRIGQVLGAIRARPLFQEEAWLFIVTSDHGGNGTGHGGQSDDERVIPIVLSGGEIPKGVITREAIGQVAVPATVCRHLGLGIPAVWGWESDGFLNGASLRASVGARSIFLSWELPSGSLAELSGFELRRNGAMVATLGAAAESFTDGSPGVPGTPLTYTLRLMGTEEADLVATATVPGVAEPGSPPVLHLRFDGDLSDASGRGNAAVAEGMMAYGPGKVGQGLALDAARSARIGTVAAGAPADLRFGADSDFSVSFWFKANALWTGDPGILSNKSWVTGANQGWIVAGENNGNDWQWNFTGNAQPRRDFDPSNANVAGNEWRLVTITHDRDGEAVFYHDGVEIGRVSITGAGDVDTAFPVRIGRDGSNAYPWNQGAYIDELKIWRRVLSPLEVASGFGGTETAFASWISGQAELYAYPGGLLEEGDDPDGDGAVNLLEFAGGTSPFRAKSRPVVEVLSRPGGSMRVRFVQRDGGAGVHGQTEGYLVDGLIYILETSGDMDDGWVPVTGIAVQNDLTSAVGAVSGTHRIAVDIPLSGSERFCRLRVCRAAP